MNQIATMNIVDTRCQNIQCVMSKYEVVASGTSIRILVMFRAKSIATAVSIALTLIFGLMFGVRRTRAIRR